MSEIKTLITRIKPGNKLSDNEYVRGRILGMQEVLLRRADVKKHDRAITILEDGSTIFSGYGTEEECEKFKSLVMKDYGGLCEFEYK